MPKTQAAEIVARIPVSEVWRGLGGGELRHGRGRAFWRKGDGFNVALSDKKGVWYDHATGEGGGVLDLVQRVLGCDRKAALRWLADYAAVPLQDTLFSTAERRAYTRCRSDFDRDLPKARLWHRTALALCEQDLTLLKSRLFDPTQQNFDSSDIAEEEGIFSRLRRLDDGGLVHEYRAWVKHYPRLTAAMLWAAEKRACAERRALERFIASLEAVRG